MRLRVIDGYNILFTHKRGRVGDMLHAREAFIRRVAALAARQKLRTLLVFDGRRGPDAILPRETHGDWLDIIYTGTAETADDAIIGIAEDMNPEDNLLVVSSDREVILHCRGYRAKIQRATEFLEELDDVLNAEESSGPAEPAGEETLPPEKTGGRPGESVEFWMRYFDVKDGE